MEVRVLGCFGGNDSTHGLTSFLIDNTLAIDAGALTNALSREEQLSIDDVIISHIHFDHTLSLPFLIDNQFGTRDKPLKIHATETVINRLKKFLLNDHCWPDFSKIFANGCCFD
jgi:ribonuclease BN (tRNA processing enzyme)